MRLTVPVVASMAWLLVACGGDDNQPPMSASPMTSVAGDAGFAQTGVTMGEISASFELVHYDVPEVTKSTAIHGSVTFEGRDVQPVAQYSTKVEP